MTTRPSPAPWADEPFKLIPTPSKASGVDGPVHGSVICAIEMADAHNCFLRALNSIVLQAPHVPSFGSPQYRAQDVLDLFSYITQWIQSVDHHHDAEETVLFPGLEALANKPGMMDGPKNQHEEFTAGLEALLAYAGETKPEDYRWEGEDGMKAIIDGFAPSLTRHLYAEIDILLSLDTLDGEGMQKYMKEVQETLKSQKDIMYGFFPFVFGSSDTTYEGGNDFPPVPSVLRYAIKYWFGAKNKGAWRFSPCDVWGKPVPLCFLPENGNNDNQSS